MTKKLKILFEGTFPITLDILCGMLHDFWLESAPSRKGTSIERLEPRLEPLEPLDEYGYFYRLYLQIGSTIFGSVADFDIRKLNDNLIKITIPSSKGNLTVYSDGEWNRILGELNNSLSTEGDLVRDYGWERMSGEIDHFLSGFGTYLQGLFPDNKETKIADQENVQESPEITLPERTKALNKLVVLWVEYKQQWAGSSGGMKDFLTDNATNVGLPLVTTNEFKRHLPKAYKAGIIGKDDKTGRFIPKLAT